MPFIRVEQVGDRRSVRLHRGYYLVGLGAFVSTIFVLLSMYTTITERRKEIGILKSLGASKSFIVKGKGSANSFCSCSHGAGRLMSRTKAKNIYTLDDLIEQTAGVECRKDEGVLDEIPGAYKPIEEVINQQRDLVEVVATLKQVVCVKG